MKFEKRPSTVNCPLQITLGNFILGSDDLWHPISVWPRLSGFKPFQVMRTCRHLAASPSCCEILVGNSVAKWKKQSLWLEGGLDVNTGSHFR